jgi:hypothetical protein
MFLHTLRQSSLVRAGAVLAASLLATSLAIAGEQGRDIFVLTSSNSTSGNEVVVFKLEIHGSPSLSLVNMLPTSGKGGASTNAGILQFRDDAGAVANWGSNSVTRIERHDDSVILGGPIELAPGCVKPQSVALAHDHLFVVGANCAETHAWPSGSVDGAVVALSDPSAAQIAVGRTWSAVTLSSGSLLQLPLAHNGTLSGAVHAITLPSDADNTPLGEDFWIDTLGFTPAHSPDSFAIVQPDAQLSAIAGPTPSFPTNAPCWVAKGRGNIWYTGNSPGEAISIFFSDGVSGVFYKSVPLPGSPSDITVSRDGKWLAVIYSVSSNAYVGVFSIDEHGDLTAVASSSAVGVAAFSGVAFSQ